MKKQCKTCGKKLSKRNKSGFCQKHYLEDLKKNTVKCPEKKRLHRNKIEQKSRRSLTGRFTQARYRAEKERGLDWGIAKSEYSELIKLPCHYCKGEINETGAGLDRIDNTKGYLLDNVVPCCGSCNITRGDRLTSEEMKVAMKAVLAFRKRKK